MRFPSPDSDVDLRGCHRLPLEKVVGLDPPHHTYEHKVDHDGLEIELVTHDIDKYLPARAEQRLHPRADLFAAGRCRPDVPGRAAPAGGAVHHAPPLSALPGLSGNPAEAAGEARAKRVKTLLYAYRVALSGIHLLRTGEVEANLGRLAGVYGMDFLRELIAQKRAELATALGLDWHSHEQRLNDLEARLLKEFEQSSLPEDRDRAPINDFLVRLRLGEREAGS